MKNQGVVTLTTAQAAIRFMVAQHVERDGKITPFFGGVFGIFGHGNVAGLGQAIQQEASLPFYMPRNEQAMVLSAIGFAKSKNRMMAMACTSSIGPGATNMVTGAATATINRIPVLLLPGDIFARRNIAPVLQQVENFGTQDISVNDCFKPVSRYWDRIERPEQLLCAFPEAMRVLTSPAETGAATLSMPQDTQAEAYNFPTEFFEPRTWTIQRPRADLNLMARAVNIIKNSSKPMVIAGGGVIYSEASAALERFAESTGIPVAETMAGKGAMRFDHSLQLGACGVTGTKGAKVFAENADVVVAIGTRLGDFTTGSKTAFQNPNVRFVNINVAEFDAAKMNGVMLVGDAKVVLEELTGALGNFSTSSEYRANAERSNKEWDDEVSRLYSLEHGPLPSQSEIIGTVNDFVGEDGVVVGAAGSLPGDLHKLWRTRHPKQYHMEYGYSCMGYEISGALGAKIAMPEREIFVMLGDGSYLMMATEIATSIQEGLKLIIILINNHGFASIGSLSESVGGERFGTKYRYKNGVTSASKDGLLPLDFVKNAEGLGAIATKANTISDLRKCIEKALTADRTTVIVIDSDPLQYVGTYGAWWDVPVAEVSTREGVRSAYKAYAENRHLERFI